MLRCFWRWPWQVPPAVQHSGMLDSKTPWPSRICVFYSSIIVNRLPALPPVLLRLSLNNTPVEHESWRTMKHECTWTPRVKNVMRHNKTQMYLLGDSKQFRLLAHGPFHGRTTSVPATDTKWLGRIAQCPSHLVSRLRGSTRLNGPAIQGNWV